MDIYVFLCAMHSIHHNLTDIMQHTTDRAIDRPTDSPSGRDETHDPTFVVTRHPNHIRLGVK